MNEADKSRVRAWVIRLSNYTEDEHIHIKDILSKAVYGIVGEEVCPTTGTPHLQGYVYLQNGKTFKAFKALIGKRAFIEPAKGTAKHNQTYCSKEGKYVEYGEIPSQGKRTDIDKVKSILQETSKIRDVVDVASSYQSIKMAEVYLKYKEKSRNWKPEVKWFYGATGTGKTFDAYEELGEDVYTCLSTAKWFEGYDAHENVLIDDMRKDFCKFHELLRLLDRYAFRVETKGGTRQFLAKKIIITSCYAPDKLFETREDVQQLLRRIDYIREYKSEYDYVVHKDNCV